MTNIASISNHNFLDLNDKLQPPSKKTEIDNAFLINNNLKTYEFHTNFSFAKKFNTVSVRNYTTMSKAKSYDSLSAKEMGKNNCINEDPVKNPSDKLKSMMEKAELLLASNKSHNTLITKKITEIQALLTNAMIPGSNVTETEVNNKILELNYLLTHKKERSRDRYDEVKNNFSVVVVNEGISHEIASEMMKLKSNDTLDYYFNRNAIDVMI
ncbi:hypothetical protein YM80_004816 [Salmonella enterica subsp. salamae]|nr:hypothetical protein [Salmonella enterica subsp. salamae]